MKSKKQASINICLANFVNGSVMQYNKPLSNTNSMQNLHLSNFSWNKSNLQLSGKSNIKCKNGRENRTNKQNTQDMRGANKSKSKSKSKGKFANDFEYGHSQSNRELSLKKSKQIHTYRLTREKKKQDCNNGILSNEGSAKKNQQMVILNKEDAKSQRKVQPPQRQRSINKQLLKNTKAEYIERPHQSQNFRCYQSNQMDAHKKLYTFCGEGKTQTNSKQGSKIFQKVSIPTQIQAISSQESATLSQHNLSQDTFMNPYIPFNSATVSHNTSYSSLATTPTIVVKQEQLKRFTQKFAREKIQFQQCIQNLNDQLNEIKSANKTLLLQKNDLVQCLGFKQQQLIQLHEKLTHQTENIKSLNKIIEETKINYENCLHEKNCQISSLQLSISDKQSKIQQLQQYIQSKLLLEQQHQDSSKLFLPLSNNNSHHGLSINTEIQFSNVNYNDEYAKISIELVEQLEFLREQHRRFTLKEQQMMSTLAYYQIQNQHVKRELQLEKGGTKQLKEQINQLKYRLENEMSIKLKSSETLSSRTSKNPASSEAKAKQKIQRLQKQIQQLLVNNAQISHSNQTLQRSLKVSSQMILCLKQENSKIKQKIVKTCQSQKSQQQKVSISEVKKIILLMMKDQLQLQDRLNDMPRSSMTKPIVQNQFLQKKYQQGYQSVKGRQKSMERKAHFKTEQADQAQVFSSGRRKIYTESSFIQEQCNFSN